MTPPRELIIRSRPSVRQSGHDSLMVVVVILGILSGIGIQQYGRVQENARKSADEANKKILTSAGQMYGMMASSIETGVDIAGKLVDQGYIDSHPKSPWAGEDDELPHYTVTLSVDEDSKNIKVDVVNIEQNPPTETE